MRRIKLALIFGLCLLMSVAAASLALAQSSWQTAAADALMQAKGEMGQPPSGGDLLVLTNAAYCQMGGQSCEAFIATIQEATGCGLGTRNLMLVHSSLSDPLWFALYRRDSGKLIYAKWSGQGFEKQAIDARPEMALSAEGWQQAASGLLGPHTFSVVSLSLTWAVNPPWHLLMAAAFHDHFCPGVNSGYIAGQYVMQKMPLGPGDKYVFVTAPAKCAADALQVMFNTTAGKSSGYALAIDGAKLKPYSVDGVAPMTVAMRVNQEKDLCEGLVLGMNWQKAYDLTGVKGNEIAPPGGPGNPIFWIARAKMSREMAKLSLEQQLGFVETLKPFSGPAALADQVGRGDPYATAMKD